MTTQYAPVGVAPASHRSVIEGLLGEVDGWHWVAHEHGMMLGFYPTGDAYEAAWHGPGNTTGPDDWTIVNVEDA